MRGWGDRKRLEKGDKRDITSLSEKDSDTILSRRSSPTLHLRRDLARLALLKHPLGGVASPARNTKGLDQKTEVAVSLTKK